MRFKKGKGSTFADILRYIASFNEIADTNIEAVFNLILEAAVTHRIPQEEMPANMLSQPDQQKKEQSTYTYRAPTYAGVRI